MTLALAATLPAAAQDRVAVLRAGETVQGALAAADSTGTSYGWVRAYRLQADAGRTYRLTGRSGAAERLRVVRPAGVLSEEVAMTYFAEGSATLPFSAREPGWYYVVVSGPGTTEFTLRADVITAVAAVPRSLVVGDRVQGRLGEQSGTLGTETGRYDLYTFQARAGQDLLLQTAGAVDASFGRMREGRFVDLEPGDTLSTPIRLRVSADGEYAVRVLGEVTETDSAGVEYVVRVREVGEARAPRRLEPGRDQAGTYDATQAVAVDDVVVEPWVVSAMPGANLVVTLRSDDFDTYVHVGRVQDGRFVEAASNDDMGGAGGTDSRVTVATQEGGDYVIWVRPYAESGGGAYTLRADVRQIVAARARPETRPVRWGAQLAGALEESDAVVEDGTPYDAWTFAATAGQRITLTLRSDAFDAFLAVGREEDGEWMELSSNDDFGYDSHDAQVVMVAPDTGEYTIRVNSFPDRPYGAYTLTVERR